MKNKISKSGLLGLKNHQFLSFIPRFAKINVNKLTNTVFFPGCAFMGQNSYLAWQTYAYLKDIFPNLGVMSYCCGNPSKAFKNGSYEKKLELLKTVFLENGIKRVITCCPNCKETLNSLDCIEVVSVWSILAEHIPETGPENRWPEFILHDPCPSRHDPKTHEDVRKILTAYNFPFTEYPHTKEATRCCGKKDMLMALYPAEGKKVLENRLKESECRHIITYCFSCVDSFKQAGCKCMHVLELCFSKPGAVNLSGICSTKRVWQSRSKFADTTKALKI